MTVGQSYRRRRRTAIVVIKRYSDTVGLYGNIIVSYRVAICRPLCNQGNIRIFFPCSRSILLCSNKPTAKGIACSCRRRQGYIGIKHNILACGRYSSTVSIKRYGICIRLPICSIRLITYSSNDYGYILGRSGLTTICPSEECVTCFSGIFKSECIVIIVGGGVCACIRTTVHCVIYGVLNDIPFCHKCGIFVKLTNSARDLNIANIPTGEGMSRPYTFGQCKFLIIRYGDCNRITSSTVGIKGNRRRNCFPICSIGFFAYCALRNCYIFSRSSLSFESPTCEGISCTSRLSESNLLFKGVCRRIRGMICSVV